MIIFLLSLLIFLNIGGWEQVQGQESLIDKNSVWLYNDSGEDLGNVWKNPSFSDESWKSGPGIFGYGNGDQTTVLDYGPNIDSKYITYYFRKRFTIADPQNYGGLRIGLLRDDGAIVYLNGIEVARDNMPENSSFETLAIDGVNGEEEITYYEYSISSKELVAGTNVIAVEIHQNDPGSSDLSFDLFAEAYEKIFDRIVITEVLPSNVSYYPDPEFNNFIDYIEIFNPTHESIALDGYFLTDDLSIKNKWSFPSGSLIEANNFLLVFADASNQGLHTNFKLSKNGEAIGLFSPDFELVDSITYPALIPNISYGKSFTGEGQVYFGTPSPGKENVGGRMSGARPNKPTISKAPGFYSSSISATLFTDHSGGRIYYTKDGSDPTENSLLYESGIQISSNTVLKAQVFSDDLLPSRIQTASYFINSEGNVQLPYRISGNQH